MYPSLSWTFSSMPHHRDHHPLSLLLFTVRWVAKLFTFVVCLFLYSFVVLCLFFHSPPLLVDPLWRGSAAHTSTLCRSLSLSQPPPPAYFIRSSDHGLKKMAQQNGTKLSSLRGKTVFIFETPSVLMEFRRILSQLPTYTNILACIENLHWCHHAYIHGCIYTS